MALPPDSSETFFKEVEENLRRDQFQNFFKTYGGWVIGAVSLVLAAVGGWIYWEQQQKQQSAAQSEELHAVFGDIADQQMKTVPQRLDKLDDSSNDIVKASAILAEAAVALDKNDRAAATAKYRQVAGDKGLPQAYRDLGTIRATQAPLVSRESNRMASMSGILACTASDRAWPDVWSRARLASVSKPSS